MRKFILIIVLFLCFNLNVYANIDGVSKDTITSFLENKTLGTKDFYCAFKTVSNNTEKETGRYVVFQFSYGDLNGNNVYFISDLTLDIDNNYNSMYGNVSWQSNVDIIKFNNNSNRAYLNKSSTTSDICKNFVVGFKSEHYIKFYPNDSDDISTDNIYAQYDSELSKEINNFEKKDDNISPCTVNGFTVTLKSDPNYVWYLGSGNYKICFTEADTTTVYGIKVRRQFDSNFKSTFKCENYEGSKITDTITNLESFCNKYLVEKDNVDRLSKKTQNNSSDITAHQTRVLEFRKYLKSKNDNIVISLSDDESIIAQKNNQNIIIKNANNYKNAITEYKNSKKTVGLPEYIIEDNGTYTFSMTNKKADGTAISGDFVYINSLSFMNVGLDENKARLRCEDLFGIKSDKNSLINFLNSYVVKTIQIGVPILLILLTSFDFVKAIFNDDEEGLNNAKRNVKVRIIASIGIFITPILLVTVISLLGGSDSLSDCIKYIMEISEEESK